MLNIRQLVELFHLLFMEQFALKADQRLYALKGGCNLRFFLQSIRYSEDIDIDVQTIAVGTLQNLVDRILEAAPFVMALRQRGLSITGVSLPKQTEMTQRWKIQLASKTQTLGFNTKIEFSRRAIDAGFALTLVDATLLSDYQLRPILINHYDHQTAFAQKILALAYRSQTQARDVFDLAHLINTGRVMQPTNITPTDISAAIENALSISHTDYMGQVHAYLLPEYKAHYGNVSFWETLQLGVIHKLEDFQHGTH